MKEISFLLSEPDKAIVSCPLPTKSVPARYQFNASDKPIAIRIFLPRSPQRLTENSNPIFIPDFSAIMFNLELFNGEAISPTQLIAQTQQTEQRGVSGNFLTDIFGLQGFVARVELVIPASFYVDVWATQNGARKQLREMWIFSQRPPNRTPQEFIAGILDAEREILIGKSKMREAERNVSFVKSETGKIIKPWESARQATLALLREEYGLLARALDAKKSPTETSKAFIADNIRLQGRVDADVNLNDGEFSKILSEAWQAHDRREKRKSKVDAADWYLASPRSWTQLYTLPMEEIANRVKVATEIELSAGAVEKRIERLGLITPRKRGKPAMPSDQDDRARRELRRRHALDRLIRMREANESEKWRHSLSFDSSSTRLRWEWEQSRRLRPKP
jgi:hypothetical protein